MHSISRTRLTLLRLLRWRNNAVRSPLWGGPLAVPADLVTCSPRRVEVLSSAGG
ncbi:MAG: hypothetical protein ACRDO7_06650 [Nocardioidaceae bacterium]